MKIRVLMITYNRAAYTQLSLSRLCESVPVSARIVVWDNNSNSETRKVLQAFEGHPRVEQIVYNKTNDRLWGPTNWFWKQAGDAELLSKVDDDCLMPDGWCETLQQAHADIPMAGVLGCWRFPPEDFHPELAAKKIQQFGAHSIMRNCWVEGSGYMMKRSVLRQLGDLKKGESFPSYCIRAAQLGFINGWYYPFLNQEHMDDPRAAHTGIKTEEDFVRLNPLSANTFDVRNRADWIKHLKRSAWTLQACSYDPRKYVGFMPKVRRWVARRIRRPIVPRVK